MKPASASPSGNLPPIKTKMWPNMSDFLAIVEEATSPASPPIAAVHDHDHGAAADQRFPFGSPPTGASGAGVFGVTSGVGRKPPSSFSEWSYFDLDIDWDLVDGTLLIATDAGFTSGSDGGAPDYPPGWFFLTCEVVFLEMAYGRSKRNGAAEAEPPITCLSGNFVQIQVRDDAESSLPACGAMVPYTPPSSPITPANGAVTTAASSRVPRRRQPMLLMDGAAACSAPTPSLRSLAPCAGPTGSSLSQFPVRFCLSLLKLVTAACSCAHV